MKRVAAAFDWQGVMPPANFRIDAWVTPPTYTGRPPMILPGLRPGEPVQTANAPVAVPAGSDAGRARHRPGATRRRDHRRARRVADATRATPPPRGHRGAALHDQRRWHRHRARRASDVTWKFTAIPDRAPTIALAKEPEAQLRGSLLLAYKLEDDYGVVDAQAIFKLASAAGTERAAAAPALRGARFPLVLPQARTRSGVGQTTKELTEHPWAGVDVSDDAGRARRGRQRGPPKPIEMRLPERPFAKPVARALIEQRRNLALDADAQATVLTALDALTLAPGAVQDRRPTSISACARSTGSSRAPRATISCATWWRGCGPWRSRSRTATSRMPSRRCARRRMRCARRWSAARATKRSRS